MWVINGNLLLFTLIHHEITRIKHGKTLMWVINDIMLSK